MYDPILSKSFSRKEQKRLGYFAAIICLSMNLSICMFFKPFFYHLSLVENAGNLQLSINAVAKNTTISPPIEIKEVKPIWTTSEPLMIKKNTTISRPIETRDMIRQSLAEIKEVKPIWTTSEPLMIKKNTTISRPIETRDMIRQSLAEIKEVKPIWTTSEPLMIKKNTTISRPIDMAETRDMIRQSLAVNEIKEVKPICTTSELLSDYCEINGDIRIEGHSSTIFIVSPSPNETIWTIQPYARKGNSGAMDNVKKWTIKLVQDHENIPKCTSNHSNIPAVLFSTGGFTGNLFHDFADLIVPIYSTSQQFKGEVQYLVTDYADWWFSKYRLLFSKLSKHEILAIDHENEISCYSNMIAGLKSYKELMIDQSSSTNGLSMRKFRNFLRKTFELERTTAIKLQKGGIKRPRLMIISRIRTRRFLNEGKITQMAKKLGFDVIVAETDVSGNLSKFANLVNSCDVLMGIHGAGLTNMVFLPENGVVIQVIPLGGIDGYARDDFGEPAKDMKINYLEYKIKVKESSLVEKFPLDHEVFRDPLSFHRKGWMEMRSIYLDHQDVRIDLRRFRSTLIRAIKILRHR